MIIKSALNSLSNQPPSKKKKAFNQSTTFPSGEGSKYNLWKLPSMVAPKKC